jgi:hypothetical protein
MAEVFGEAIRMPCGVCGEPIVLRGDGAAGPTLASVSSFARQHSRCLGELVAAGRLSETIPARRYRLMRETLHRAHDGPHAMLRTISHTEIEFLIGPLLDLIEELEEQKAAAPRAIHLTD